MTMALPTDETIAAVASAIAPGQGAVAIIKISGPSAKKVVSNIVKIPGKQVWDTYTILYGHVINQTTKKITHKGLPNKIICGATDWVYEEEFSCRDGFIFNEDGTKIAFWQIDANQVRDFYMINNTCVT